MHDDVGRLLGGGAALGLKVVVSGMTAAGKTTHSELLARDLGIAYVSATSILADLVSKRTGAPAQQRWQPSMDVARQVDASIDDELDARLLERLETDDGGVYDACLLPWLTPANSVVNVWIESDLPSRLRKCVVSHWGEGIYLPQARPRVAAKDAVTSARLWASCAATYKPDGRFHVVAANTDLIPRARPEVARNGIRIFQPLLAAAVRYASGTSDQLPVAPRILRLTKIGDA